MNKLKENLAVKIIFFILMQICIVAFILCGIVIAYNAGNGWYSKDSEKVKDEIMHIVAMEFSCELADDLCEVYIDEYYDDDYITQGSALGSGTGYSISYDEEAFASDTFENVVTEVPVKSGKSIYSETFNHYIDAREINITVSLTKPDSYKGDIQGLYPESVEELYTLQNNLYNERNNALISAVVLLVTIVFLLAYMFMAAGTKRKEGSLLNKIPLDLTMASAVLITILSVAYIYNTVANGRTNCNMDLIVLLFVGFGFILSTLISGALWMFAARVKLGEWWKCTLIYHLCNVCKRLVVWILKMVEAGAKKLPLIWKAILLAIIVLIINFVIACNWWWSDFAVLCWGLGAVIIIVGVGYICLSMKKLALGAERIAAGNLEHKINCRGLLWEFRHHAEHLNSIGDNISNAVEMRMKNERFKTELITNVSHDIKTPLTSIINYVDLLKKEKLENENVKEYIDILDRQSRRLKKLTDDIVEASKTSTGNVSINLEPCNAGVLLAQSVGEYKEKADKADLKFVVKVPENDILIIADGRRLWRVFDNLLNNVCKYAQPGTRVYVTLEDDDKEAVITYRNVSKYELDITEDELMERFVRGDKSRHTDGSGLGLSIARNLVELQGGKFDIVIDGDLFKVMITFKKEK